MFSVQSIHSHNFKASIQCWAIIGLPVKRHQKRFAEVQLMAGFMWYLDPLSPHQLKTMSKVDSL